jgi:hypothetical protein
MLQFSPNLYGTERGGDVGHGNNSDGNGKDEKELIVYAS